jgi:hypothetical protein
VTSKIREGLHTQLLEGSGLDGGQKQLVLSQAPQTKPTALKERDISL